VIFKYAKGFIMKIEVSDLRNGSCNFCKRGELTEDGVGLIYPYKKVTQISADKYGVSVRFCDLCLKEVKAI